MNVRPAQLPLAERKAARRRLLLDAGREILGADGLAGARVRLVCERAGLTERYFYENFAGLEEFVPAVVEDVALTTAAQVIDRIDARPADRSPGWAGLSEWLRIVDEDPGAARILLVETLAGGPRLMELRRRVVLGSAVVLASRMTRSERPDPNQLWEQAGALGAEWHREQSLDPMLVAFAGAVTEITVARLEGLVMSPHDELVDTLLSAFRLAAA